MLEWLPLVFTAGWASGVNAYGVVLLLGLYGRFLDIAAIPDVLTRKEVLIVAGILFLLEAVADKIPYLDSVWDSVHTFIRPTIGAALGLLLTGEVTDWDQAIGAAIGGTSALAAHGVKMTLRLAVNTSPEPASNTIVSVLEDITVAGVISLMIVSPWVAAGVAAVLLVVGIIVAFFALRLAKKGLKKVKAKREQRQQRGQLQTS